MREKALPLFSYERLFCDQSRTGVMCIGRIELERAHESIL